jgi:hypothetical protein
VRFCIFHLMAAEKNGVPIRVQKSTMNSETKKYDTSIFAGRLVWMGFVKNTAFLKKQSKGFCISDLQWTVHSPDVDDILMAAELQRRYSLSFWDGMILCSFRALDCGILWSEDLNAGQIFAGVKVLTPFQQ